MPGEFKIKNGVIVDQGGANISGSSAISGSLAINASGSSVFTVDGTSGRLFSVDDSLSGSLFSVNTAAGLPIIEAFSNNTVRIGQFGRQALFVSQSKVGIGKENALNGILDVSGSVSVTGSLLATQSYISTVDWVDLTNNAISPFAEGRISWDVDRKTLQIDTDVNNFTISAGHVNVLRGRNTNSFTLNAGSVVYISGNSGQFATFSTASWDNEGDSAYTIGIIPQTINSNQFGYAVIQGEITGINTNAYTPGTLLYLSSSGQYTNQVPTAPRHTVRLGQVVVQSTSGILQVKVDNGYELGELHNVTDNTTSSSYGDLLVNSGSIWINSKQLTGSYGLTGSLNVSQGITGSLLGTSSLAATASSVSNLNQTVTLGNITSTPSTEATLNVYPPIVSGTGEGGQILLAASGGLYTSASMLDTYQNYFRILRGTNTGGSTAQLVGLDLQTGNLSIAGAISPSAWVAGDIIQMRSFKPGDSGVFTKSSAASSTSNETFFSCSFTPKSTTSYIVAQMTAKYEPGAGATGDDDYYSTLTINGPSGTEMGYSYQKFTATNNNRSGVLFPLSGRFTNTGSVAVTVCANIRRGTADDNINLDNTNANSMTMIVTEIGR